MRHDYPKSDTGLTMGESGQIWRETMKHSIERTNPKGQPFIGVCRLCGEQNLKITDATKDCPNVRGLSPDEALLEAINPTKH